MHCWNRASSEMAKFAIACSWRGAKVKACTMGDMGMWGGGVDAIDAFCSGHCIQGTSSHAPPQRRRIGLQAPRGTGLQATHQKWLAVSWSRHEQHNLTHNDFAANATLFGTYC